ncbi:MAG TPA: hypothetical protein VF905_06555 [Nitrospirota bacterium]
MRHPAEKLSVGARIIIPPGPEGCYHNLHIVICYTLFRRQFMKITLADLENVAKELSIKISYDDLKTSKGGACRVLETRRIIINKHLQNQEKIKLLARELGNFDLSGLEMSEQVRKKIEKESEPRTGG